MSGKRTKQTALKSTGTKAPRKPQEEASSPPPTAATTTAAAAPAKKKKVLAKQTAKASTGEKIPPRNDNDGDSNGNGNAAVTASLTAAIASLSKPATTAATPASSSTTTTDNNNTAAEPSSSTSSDSKEEKKASTTAAKPKMKAVKPKPKQADTSGDIDIGYVMAPLTREQIEMVLIRMLAKHPEDIDLLLAESKKPVDLTVVSNTVLDCFGATLAGHSGASSASSSAAARLLGEDERGNNEGMALMQIIGELEGTVDRASDYAKGGDAYNAIAILEMITAPMVLRCTMTDTYDDIPSNDNNEHDLEAVNTFFATLENTFTAAIANMKDSDALVKPVKGKASSSSESGSPMGNLFKKLGGWRTALTPLLGPIFSDPLRALKKRVTDVAGAEAAAKIESSAAHANTSGATVGKKKKAAPSAAANDDTSSRPTKQKKVTK